MKKHAEKQFFVVAEFLKKPKNKTKTTEKSLHLPIISLYVIAIILTI